jgi:DNA-directed RNA polymerase subunit RPC12/RpoP
MKSKPFNPFEDFDAITATRPDPFHMSYVCPRCGAEWMDAACRAVSPSKGKWCTHRFSDEDIQTGRVIPPDEEPEEVVVDEC